MSKQIWVDNPKELKEKLHVKFFEMGPAVNHNLMCWVCNDNPAVYSMHPNWVFKPCWKCQELMRKDKVGALTRFIQWFAPQNNCNPTKEI